jgi:superfamily II DNA helicase RecQ
MTGIADIMVATGAFGVGIDFGAIRLIVHMDEPYSMIDLAQESGRGGRDGLPCRHIILLPMLWRLREGTCSKLVEFLRGLKCRHWVLQEYTDGSRFDCFSSGSKRCDSCRSMAHVLYPTIWPPN